MEKKQSSIDYFFEEVVKWQMKPWLYASDGLEPIIKQAKAMHKEEQEQTWEIAWEECSKFDACKNKYNDGFNQYYSETFGGNNE